MRITVTPNECVLGINTSISVEVRFICPDCLTGFLKTMQRIPLAFRNRLVAIGGALICEICCMIIFFFNIECTDVLVMPVDCDIDRTEETPYSLIAPISLTAFFTACVLSSLNTICFCSFQQVNKTCLLRLQRKIKIKLQTKKICGRLNVTRSATN